MQSPQMPPNTPIPSTVLQPWINPFLLDLQPALESLRKCITQSLTPDPQQVRSQMLLRQAHELGQQLPGSSRISASGFKQALELLRRARQLQEKRINPGKSQHRSPLKLKLIKKRKPRKTSKSDSVDTNSSWEAASNGQDHQDLQVEAPPEVDVQIREFMEEEQLPRIRGLLEQDNNTDYLGIQKLIF